MKIDFHIHGKLSKKVDFSEAYLISIIEAAKKEGLSAMTLTEHFNTYRFNDIYKTLDERFNYVDDYYDVNDFRLFPAIEVDVKEGGHILITANRDVIKQLREKLIEYEEPENFIEIENLMELCKPFEVLIIGAHPLRSTNPLTRIPKEILKQFDAFDLNARDLNCVGIKEMCDQVYAFAEVVNKPVVGGSDTHHPLQVGSIFNDFDKTCSTISELKTSIQQNAYQVNISPCLITKVQAAEIVKPILVANLVGQGR